MEFTGAYGIVLKTDEQTAEKAVDLAGEIMPDGADYKVEKQAAHITLYHLQMEGLDSGRMMEILAETREKIGQCDFSLEQVAVMGGKFLFWDVKDREKLLAGHQSALAMAEFLDREKVAKAVSEGLLLNEEQLGSLKKYGHTLIGEKLYRPHITLGYDKEKLAGMAGVARKHDSKVEKVIFGEIGEYGKLVKVVAECG